MMHFSLPEREEGGGSHRPDCRHTLAQKQEEQ